MTDELPPRLPDVHVTKDFSEDGREFREAVTSPVCDFCMDIGPAWEYGCRDFHLEVGEMIGTDGKAWGSVGSWLACEACANYIDENALDSVIARGILCKIVLFGRDTRSALAETTIAIAGFFEHMTGEKKPFG